ncbi:MAG: DUF3617 domain-containing protein [Sphingomonadales bacterium]|nr:DUF3617 domain-containing protein [Sphingomonadales bacterium]
MRLPFIALVALIPLAACDSGPSVTATNATQKEVQEKVADAVGGGDAQMVEPGRWEGAMTVHEIDIPNMPAAAKEQMKQSMAGAKSFVSCVTPEDVKAQKAFFTGDEDDKSCKYDHFRLAGGKLDAALSCDRGEAGKMHMTMTGSYAPQSYRMDMASKAEGGPGHMGAMSMRMTVEAKRVGACRGDEDKL